MFLKHTAPRSTRRSTVVNTTVVHFGISFCQELSIAPFHIVNFNARFSASILANTSALTLTQCLGFHVALESFAIFHMTNTLYPLKTANYTEKKVGLECVLVVVLGAAKNNQYAI